MNLTPITSTRVIYTLSIISILSFIFLISACGGGGDFVEDPPKQTDGTKHIPNPPDRIASSTSVVCSNVGCSESDLQD